MEHIRDLFRDGWDFEPAYAEVFGADRSRVDEAWGWWRAWEAERSLGDGEGEQAC